MNDTEVTHAKLSKALQTIKAGAVEIIQTEESFPNIIFIIGMDFVNPIPFLFQNSEQKSLLVKLIKTIAKKDNAIGIIMASDAWTTRHKHDGSVDINKITPPSQSPDRTQALIITATGLDFSKGFLIPYNRINGKVVLEKEEDIAGFEDLNFSSLFKKKFDA